jgi:hypothetical protein
VHRSNVSGSLVAGSVTSRLLRLTDTGALATVDAPAVADEAMGAAEPVRAEPPRTRVA